jgi:hypothetical protein
MRLASHEAKQAKNRRAGQGSPASVRKKISIAAKSSFLRRYCTLPLSNPLGRLKMVDNSTKPSARGRCDE